MSPAGLGGGGESEPTEPLWRRYDALLLDLDGVVHRGDQPVPEAVRTLSVLAARGARTVFLTNNSARTPRQVADRLAGFGIEVDPGSIVTSAVATASLLAAEGLAGATAFVIGERGIREALADAGIVVVDGAPGRTDLVVVGWDRGVDYAKLRAASLLVQRGARLVATNGDASYPAPDGLWPGAGAILAAVVTATGARPTIVGKPHRPLFEAAAAASGSLRPLVVGDRLDTDVAGAAALGWDSLLVLTGASRTADLLRTAHVPTFVSPDLSGVLRSLPRGDFRVASAADAGPLRALLEAAGLSSSGLEDRLDRTVVRREGSGPVDATACVEDLDGQGLLRSVAVRPAVRRSGLATLAVVAAARLARDRGIRRLSLFTETAAGFFSKLGFLLEDRERLPGPVRESAQAAGECALSAVAMVADLGAGPGPEERPGAAV